jgi:amidase
MPAADSLFVARMKAAGCIVVGKTNMPEFGLGSHTYNNRSSERRPTPGTRRSVPAAAAAAPRCALAQRLLPVADGSDFMGSLRNPAGWNHVFGMRPSQGRVPAWPKPELFVSQLGSDGPMARTVHDLARLLSLQAGRDPRAPLSISDGPQDFVPPADASAKGQRIGWLGDLGGHLPMEPGILEVCEAALARLAGDGAIVEPTPLGFDADALWRAWLLWRRALVAPAVAQALALPGAREQIKPEALWEHDQAAGLSANDFMAAAQVRSAFYGHLQGLFERYDALALPVAQVWPFEMATHWPKTVAGRTMDTYHRCFHNPMGLMGFEFVEFASPVPGVLEPVFEMLGFSRVAANTDRRT